MFTKKNFHHKTFFLLKTSLHKNHASSSPRKSRNLFTQKITQFLNKKSHNLSVKKIMQPLEEEKIMQPEWVNEWEKSRNLYTHKSHAASPRTKSHNLFFKARNLFTKKKPFNLFTRKARDLCTQKKLCNLCTKKLRNLHKQKTQKSCNLSAKKN